MLHGLFAKSTSHPGIQIFRYIISGGIAFIADTVTNILLVKFAEMSPVLASVFGFSVGSVITYYLSVYWIFDERRLNSPYKEFVVFTTISFIGLALNTLFIALFWQFIDEKTVTNIVISKILATIVVTIWNFTTKKYLLFIKK